MDLNKLLTRTCAWLQGDGNESDIVLSTRIRLARNIKGFVFLTRATPKQFWEIEQYIAEKFKSLPEIQNYTYLSLDEIPGNDIYFLFERHLISKEHAIGKWRRSVLFTDDETLSVMVNEEDHLRIQLITSGLEIASAWKRLNALDDLLATILPFAFHSQFGYLTACPTNVGTGMRLSVMLHLPGLRITNQMEKIRRALAKHNLYLRGFYGEGTVALGDFFQLSNQITLGKTEDEILRTLDVVVAQVLKYEREVRHSMVAQNRKQLEISVQEAYRSIAQATTLSSEQAMTHLSLIRMAVNLGLLPLPMQQVNELFILSQPAHLQKAQGRELSSQERDEIRAALFTKRLSSIPNN